MNIKAIETVYKGYRFRSRLEARWAVFFDAMGIEWDYEKEGFDLGEIGYYLPDFWLPRVEMWAEVKPTLFTSEEKLKIKELSRLTNTSVLMLEGVPDCRSYFAMYHGYDPDDVDFSTDYLFEEGSHYYETENLFFMSTGASYPVGLDLHDFLSANHCPMCDAVNAARSARFEHGEQPVTVKRVQPRRTVETPPSEWFSVEDYLVGLLYQAEAALVELDAFLVSRNLTPVSVDDFQNADNRALWVALQECSEPTGTAHERLGAIMGKMATRPPFPVHVLPRETQSTLLRLREQQTRAYFTVLIDQMTAAKAQSDTAAAKAIALNVQQASVQMERIRRCLTTTLRSN